MTRGYVILLKDGKIFKVVESPSDSYVSGLGMHILSLFENNEFEVAFSNINPIGSEEEGLTHEGAISSFYGDNNKHNSLPLTMEDIIKTKANKDDYFLDYSYIYNINKDVLKVYDYGELLYTITREDIEKYKIIFKNENVLYKIFSYDEKSCSLKLDFNKGIKKFLKQNPTTEDINKLILNYKPKLHLSCGKIADVWGDGSYQRVVQDDNYNEVVKFIISTRYGSTNLIIQLPFIRKTILIAKSPMTCEKEIIRLIKEEPNKLINFRVIFNMYKEKKKELISLKNNVSSDEFKTLSKEIIDKFYGELSSFCKNNSYLKTAFFNEKEIYKELNDSVYYILKSYKN